MTFFLLFFSDWAVKTGLFFLLSRLSIQLGVQDRNNIYVCHSVRKHLFRRPVSIYFLLATCYVNTTEYINSRPRLLKKNNGLRSTTGSKTKRSNYVVCHWLVGTKNKSRSVIGPACGHIYIYTASKWRRHTYLGYVHQRLTRVKTGFVPAQKS